MNSKLSLCGLNESARQRFNLKFEFQKFSFLNKFSEENVLKDDDECPSNQVFVLEQ